MGLPVLNELVHFWGTFRFQKVEVGRGSGDALVQPHCSEQGWLKQAAQALLLLAVSMTGWRFHSHSRQHAPVFNPHMVEVILCLKTVLEVKLSHCPLSCHCSLALTFLLSPGVLIHTENLKCFSDHLSEHYMGLYDIEQSTSALQWSLHLVKLATTNCTKLNKILKALLSINKEKKQVLVFRMSFC